MGYFGFPGTRKYRRGEQRQPTPTLFALRLPELAAGREQLIAFRNRPAANCSLWERGRSWMLQQIFMQAFRPRLLRRDIQNRETFWPNRCPTHPRRSDERDIRSFSSRGSNEKKCLLRRLLDDLQVHDFPVGDRKSTRLNSSHPS